MTISWALALPGGLCFHGPGTRACSQRPRHFKVGRTHLACPDCCLLPPLTFLGTPAQDPKGAARLRKPQLDPTMETHRVTPRTPNFEIWAISQLPLESCQQKMLHTQL